MIEYNRRFTLNKGITFFKTYWLEILVFAAVFALYMIDLNPSFTFMNKAADSMGYIYSAKYLYPSYQTSPPLFLLLGHLFLMLPVATEAWRMAFMSLLASMGTCVFVYLIVKKMTVNKLYALLAVMIFGFAAIVVSTTSIVETYPLVTMFATGALYFALCKKWKTMAAMLGAGAAVHMLGVIAVIIFFVGFKEYRKSWKVWGITLLFALFYLYIPITNLHAPAMWAPKSMTGVIGIASSVYATVITLIGGISIWDLPKRIFDIAGVVGVSIGVVSIIPIISYFVIRSKETVKKYKYYKDVLFWLSVMPIFFAVSSLDMNMFDYTFMAMPYLAILAAVGLWKMNIKWSGVWTKVLVGTTVIAVVGLGCFNGYYFNIGTTEDPQMSANEFYYTELPKLPSDAIFMPVYGWNWEATYLYNKDKGEHIYPILMPLLTVPAYRDQLIADGIKMTVIVSKQNDSDAEFAMARSIIQDNSNVWTTVEPNPNTFMATIVPANGNTALVPTVDAAVVAKDKVNPGWRWMPYNPYNIMTTAIYISDWKNIIYSNYNVQTMIMLGVIGGVPCWIAMELWKDNKKKKMLNKIKVVSKTNEHN